MKGLPAPKDLAAISEEQLKAIVQGLPVDRRAGFSKACKAACQHLKDSRRNYEDAYKVASAMVENWWCLGLELQRLELKQGRPKNTPQGEHFRLRDLGINENQSARCQKLAELPLEGVHEWLESSYDPQTYYLPSLRPAAEHVSHNSGEVEWYTPKKYIDAAREVLGQIDLDPATSEEAQQVVAAKHFYTKDDDGLDQPWFGRVWMNPPYASRQVDAFMMKLKHHFDLGDVEQAITLTNNATDTGWFHDCCASAKASCFHEGRIRFTGKSSGTPLQGQVFLYFGTERDRFVSVFSQFGFCWVPA